MANEDHLIPGMSTDWVALQMDIAGHSRIEEPRWVLLRAKEALHQLACEIVERESGEVPLVFMPWAGDGGAFLMHAWDGRSCDRVVRAAIAIQEAMPAFNEANRIGELDMRTPLRLRVSVGMGTAMYAKNPGNIHGDFLNRFFKYERAMGRLHRVTVTDAVFQELCHPLKERFVDRFEVPELVETVYASVPLVRGLEHETDADVAGCKPDPAADFEACRAARDIEGGLRAFHRFACRQFGQVREDGEALFEAFRARLSDMDRAYPEGSEAFERQQAEREQVFVKLAEYLRRHAPKEPEKGSGGSGSKTPGPGPATGGDVPEGFVRHFRVSRASGEIIGGGATVEHFRLRPGESIEVEADLAEPGYAWLILIGPGDDVSVVYPADAAEAPPAAKRAWSGGPKSRSLTWKLDNEPGFMMAALVASRRPLGTFAKSDLAETVRSVFTRVEPTLPNAVWLDDGGGRIRMMTMDRAMTLERGFEESSPEEVLIERVTDTLKPFGESCQVLGFTVSAEAKRRLPEPGALQRRVENFAAALADASARSMSDEKYQHGFSEEGKRKAQYILDFIENQVKGAGIDPRTMGYVSLGGADGSELEYVLRHTEIRHGVLLEYSDKANEYARFRAEGLKRTGKTMHVLQGDALARLSDAADRLRQAGLAGVICSAQAILHELPMRSKHLFQEKGWSGIFGELFAGFEHGAFVSREPCAPKNWPSRVRLRMPGVEAAKLKKLAELIAGELGRHAVGLNYGSVIVTGREEIQADSILAVETLHKVLRREEKDPADQVGRFLVEMGERLTSFDATRIVEELHHRLGVRPSFRYLTTDGFRELYEKYGIEATAVESPEPLPMPQTHATITAVRCDMP